MAIALDLAAALMANGKSGLNLDEEGRGSCTGCCQIFIAYDPYLFGTKEEIQEMLNKRVAAADATHPEKEGGKVTCPGERTIETRKKSMESGVNVDELIWDQIVAISKGNLDTKDIASK
jgi:3-dehydro-L-gulonate 2-dehydrogenase